MSGFIDKVFGIEPLYAHCDVPCGVYDPQEAAIAAKTVFMMAKKISDLPVPGSDASAEEVLAYKNTLIRMVTTKEEHSENCKHHLLVLWTDYFKAEHLSLIPDLHETFWKAAKLCSDNKRAVDTKKAQALVDAVAAIGELFNKAEAAKK